MGGRLQEPQRHSPQGKAILIVQLCADVGSSKECLLWSLWQPVTWTTVNWWMPLGGSVSAWLRSVKRPISAASASVAVYLHHKQRRPCSLRDNGPVHFMPGKKKELHHLRFSATRPSLLSWLNISWLQIYNTSFMMIYWNVEMLPQF